MILQLTPFKKYILSHIAWASGTVRVAAPLRNHHHINCKLKLRQLKLKMRFTIKNQS